VVAGQDAGSKLAKAEARFAVRLAGRRGVGNQR
jgi:hypothetical protein